MKIVSIVGARPQFIKAAAVSRVLRSRRGISEVLVHTGQHYDKNMSDVFFAELDIPPPDLNLAVGSGRHGEQTARMLEAIENTLLTHEPDMALVYGDTNSTLAGALAAAKLHIPLAHVEAGLRSFNRRMPEEINRIVADQCAELLLAPTQTGVDNLLKEGIDPCRVMLVGDVMYDVALHYSKKSERFSHILDELDLQAGNYVLATVHRAENTDEPTRLHAIFEALEQIAKGIPVVVPVHPRTRAMLPSTASMGQSKGRLRLIDPVGYLDMVMLEKNARLIATDSGGVQKEAYFHAVPCITLRDETEWVELIDSGWNTLVTPSDSACVAEAIERALDRRIEADSRPMFYGDGHAAENIVAAIEAAKLSGRA